MILLENIGPDDLKKYIKEFYNYAKKHLQLEEMPKVVLKKDSKNAEDMFGKTGFYEPKSKTIALFTVNRHPKDILRSFAHELIHHKQNCGGLFNEMDMSRTSDIAYAKNDKDLKKMEEQAFLEGNMMFRNWCDENKIKRTQIMSESKKNEEVVQGAEKIPHPELFQKKERIFKERFQSHEEVLYQELLKRAIK